MVVVTFSLCRDKEKENVSFCDTSSSLILFKGLFIYILSGLRRQALYIQFRLLLGKQFLEFSTKGLAHGTVSHRLITFDTVLQHHNFIYVFFIIVFFLCFPRFGKRFLLLFLFSNNTAKIQIVRKVYVVEHKNNACIFYFLLKKPCFAIRILQIYCISLPVLYKKQ